MLSTLVSHLAQSNQTNQLHILFENQEWMHAHFDADGGYDLYISDVIIALEEVVIPELRAQIETEQDTEAIVFCIRYALIRTKLNGAANAYFPEQVARAVELGLWSLDHALSIARRANTPSRCVQICENLLKMVMLTTQERDRIQKLALDAARKAYDEVDTLAVIPYLPEANQQEIIDLIRGRDKKSGAWRDEPKIWGMLSLYLQGSERNKVMNLALEKALEAPDPGYVKLKSVAPYLTGEFLERAFSAVLAIEHEFDRAPTLNMYADYLTKDQRELALRHAKKLHYSWTSQYVVAAIARNEDQAMLNGVISLASVPGLGEPQFYTWAAIVPALNGLERERVLDQIIDAVVKSQNVYFQRDMLELISRYLTGTALSKAVDVAINLYHQGDQGWDMLRRLVANADRVVLQKSMNAVLTQTRNDQYALLALLPLARQLSDPFRIQLFRYASETANRISRAWDRVMLLSELAAQLDGPDRAQTLDLAVEAYTTLFEDIGVGSDSDQKLLTQLSEYQMTYLLDKWLSVNGRGKNRVSVLIGVLVPFLPSWMTFREADYRATRAIKVLAPHLTPSLLSRCLQETQRIWDKELKAEALLILSKRFTGKQRQELIKQAFRVAMSTRLKDSDISDTLIELTGYLTGLMRERAAKRAIESLKHQSKDNQISGFARLIPIIEGKLFEDLWQRLIHEQEHYYRWLALSTLAGNVRGSLAHRILDETINLNSEDSIGSILIPLAENADSKLLARIYEFALTLKISSHRISVLYELANRLPEAEQTLATEEGISQIITFSSEEKRRFMRHRSRQAQVDKLLKTSGASSPLFSYSGFLDQTMFSDTGFDPKYLEPLAKQLYEICLDWEWS